MRIVEIKALNNGAHRNQTISGCEISMPDGWAILPDDMECKNFPFGELETEEVVRTRYVESLQEVTKTREVLSFDEDGNRVVKTEEYIEEEIVTEPEEYVVLVVSKWIAGEMPEVKEVELEPSPKERITALEKELELLREDVRTLTKNDI